MGLLPYLCFRHQLGRKAKKMTLDIKSLLQEKLDNVSVKPESMPTDFSQSGYESFESQSVVMREIEAALKDSNVRMIGVVGPGGVGKTTLVKEVAKKAERDNLFNVVVMVNVTRDPNLKKIQNEIAERLVGSTLEEESEMVRAYHLRKILKNEKRNILIILDDLWEGLDLNKLGISFDDDDNFSHMTGGKDKQKSDSNEMKKEKSSTGKDKQNSDSNEMKKEKSSTGKDKQNSDSNEMKKEESSSNYKECKILLTSRSKDVLSIQMDVKMEPILSVGLLEENEAKTLFKKLVDKVPEKNSEFEKLMDEIIKKCDCLPMAIIAVGKALRNKSDTEWKEALERLNRQGFTGVHKSMEFSTKLSYDHLESEEFKLTFLLCAQMGPHPLVMDLVKYCVGLGILEGVHTIREARNRINRMIQKFENDGLLLHSDSSDYFNMHDTIRDAASLIASKEQNIFTLRNCKLDEWPKKDELKTCTSIFLHNCDIIDGLPESINCPQLEVFYIDNVDSSLSIPANFFKGMTKLKVLILNGIHIQHLSSSIEYLTNLRVLCMERSVLEDKLIMIGELKQLRIVSLSGSNIEELPGEIRQLTNLQWLDISNCSKLRVIPPNVVSSLTSLEELYMRNSLIQREVEGETNQSLMVVLNELSYLYKLLTLDISISNVEVMPKNLFLDKLDNYKIMIGDFKLHSVKDFKMPDKCETSRALALQIKEGNDIHSQKGIKMLFKRVEHLLLGDLNGVCDALFELNLEGFSCLKHFFIYENSDIQYIIKSMGIVHPHKVFPKLESLCLYKLQNMEILFNNRLRDGSLYNLKTIKIETCSRLKFLVSFDLVRLLNNLETIEVSDCNSLEEIVAGKIEENANTSVKDDKIKFPQLRYLALRTLQKFIGFYANDESIFISQSMEITEEEKPAIPLFSEQVFIPKIESLELSSIIIHNIWGHQPSSNFCFQKLTKLGVDKCDGLKYLFSFSVAKNLENLKDLSVSYCEMMEGIFYPEEVSTNEAEAIIFPKLENIQLTFMKKLSTIWHSQVCSEGSFHNLNSVVIIDCDQLVTIFPSHVIGILKNLVSLRVSNCDSVEAIFVLEDTLHTKGDGNETKLQRIFLEFLPNLKLVWSRDPKGILNYKNLQAIKVYECSVLQHILPVSVARDIQKLESLEASDCGELEEIVALTEEGSETSSNTFMIPQVTKLILEELPKLRRHNVEWTTVKHMIVRDCEKLEAFTTDIIKLQEVIPDLEYMEIDLKEAECLMRCVGNYLMPNLKHLSFDSLNSSDIVYWFLHKTPNLEHLWLENCQFEELLPSGSLAAREKIGTVVQLKDLRLMGLDNLQNIGLERDPVLQRVESLTLWNCSQLIELVSSSVSFTHLTYLEVFRCDRLMNLMGSSTAKTLVQLTTMKVKYCEAMEEIVAKEGNEEENVVKIVFSKLITLELMRLKNLSSFCSSKMLAFNFPSLENLLVTECYKMKMFTKGVTSAPNLQNVRMEDDKDAESYWEGDLNSTIQNLVHYEYLKDLKLSEYPELERVWHGELALPEKSFRNLTSLVMENLKFISKAIPSHLLPYLKSLKELQVRSCTSVEVIFDIKGEKMTFCLENLEKLILDQLPNMKHVWNKDPQRALRLESLQDVHITNCEGLKVVFPESLAKNLVKLKKLRIETCKALEEIVGKEELAAEGTSAKFVFPCLTSVTLTLLPELKWFYYAKHKLRCPILQDLRVYHCCKLKIFTSDPQSYQEAHPEDHVRISFQKIFPKVEELSLSEEETMMFWHGDDAANILNRLIRLQLCCFHNVKEAETLPWGFLQKVPKIETLAVACSDFDEIFSSQGLDVDVNVMRIFAQLNGLRVENLPKLISIGLEQPWLDTFRENLKILEVSRCPCLPKLVQSPVSFSNLRELLLNKCDRLVYLFTSSTAKSLGSLKRMSIEECESLKEIVATEGDELSQDDIIFEKLRKLSLNSLPCLASFYAGSSVLTFPSLGEVMIAQCPTMKIFSQGLVIAPVLIEVQTSMNKDDLLWEGDLKTTIEKMFKEKAEQDNNDAIGEGTGENDCS